MTRRDPPNDTTAARRNAARDLMRTVRELGQQLGEPGVASSNIMAARIAGEADKTARRWLGAEAQRLFLITFAAEVRHEPHEPDSPLGQFLARIAALIDEAAGHGPARP